jgi:hypothetical protein
MTRIVMDDVLREKLNGLNEVVELCDASGHVLARVVPTPMQVALEDLIPPISEEELQRRLNTPPSRTYTTEEVLRHLESL